MEVRLPISEAWFLTLDQDQRELVELSVWLYQRELQSSDSADDNSANNPGAGDPANHLADYSFIVFPISKAYEGFLKKYLLSIGVMSQAQYESKHFRIGRALNPDISNDYKDEQWLYDDVAERCGEDVAREIWQTWLECRNQVFHYFPSKKGTLTLAETRAKLQQVMSSMQLVFACKVNSRQA